MKRILAIMLSLTMAFALVACSDKGDDKNGTTENTDVQTEKPTEEKNDSNKMPTDANGNIDTSVLGEISDEEIEEIVKDENLSTDKEKADKVAQSKVQYEWGSDPLTALVPKVDFASLDKVITQDDGLINLIYSNCDFADAMKYYKYFVDKNFIETISIVSDSIIFYSADSPDGTYSVSVTCDQDGNFSVFVIDGKK